MSGERLMPRSPGRSWRAQALAGDGGRPPSHRSGSMDFEGIDHLELYVSDAERVAGQLCADLGFHVAGKAGPETGHGARRSLLLQQGHIRVVLTQAASPGDEAAA